MCIFRYSIRYTHWNSWKEYLIKNYDSRLLKTINIIIAGKTGVGKSTLIISVLGVELAKTGVGKANHSKKQRI